MHNLALCCRDSRSFVWSGIGLQATAQRGLEKKNRLIICNNLSSAVSVKPFAHCIPTNTVKADVGNCYGFQTKERWGARYFSFIYAGGPYDVGESYSRLFDMLFLTKTTSVSRLRCNKNIFYLTRCKNKAILVCFNAILKQSSCRIKCHLVVRLADYNQLNTPPITLA